MDFEYLKRSLDRLQLYLFFIGPLNVGSNGFGFPGTEQKNQIQLEQQIKSA